MGNSVDWMCLTGCDTERIDIQLDAGNGSIYGHVCRARTDAAPRRNGYAVVCSSFPTFLCLAHVRLQDIRYERSQRLVEEL